MGGTARGDYGQDDLSAGLGVAFNLASAKSKWLLTPMLRLNWSHSVQESFRERGSPFGVEVGEVAMDHLITKTGLMVGRYGALTKSTQMGLEGAVFWIHDFPMDNKAMSFGMGGIPYSAQKRELDPDAVQVQLSFRADYSDTMSLRLGGQHQSGAQGRMSSGILSLSVPF